MYTPLGGALLSAHDSPRNPESTRRHGWVSPTGIEGLVLRRDGALGRAGICPRNTKPRRNDPAGLVRYCGVDLLSQESYSPSTIGAEKLNCCVRDGNRCDLLANNTTKCWAGTPVEEQADDFVAALCRTMCVFAEGGARLEATRAISITRLNTLRCLHL